MLLLVVTMVGKTAFMRDANRRHADTRVVSRPDTLSTSWGMIMSSNTGMTTATTVIVMHRLQMRDIFGTRSHFFPLPDETVKTFFSKKT